MKHAEIAAIALALLLTGGPLAFAQKKGGAGNEAPGPAATAGDKKDASKVKVERGAGGTKIYRITEEIKIEGKVQKPEAFYVLQRSKNIGYDWQELKQDFIPKILDSVQKAPF